MRFEQAQILASEKSEVQPAEILVVLIGSETFEVCERKYVPRGAQVFESYCQGECIGIYQ